jgi:hypothetical protein
MDADCYICCVFISCIFHIFIALAEIDYITRWWHYISVKYQTTAAVRVNGISRCQNVEQNERVFSAKNFIKSAAFQAQTDTRKVLRFFSTLYAKRPTIAQAKSSAK